jgi:DNA-binding CsgD family transcriptional regulator
MYTAKKVGMITNIAKELQKSKPDFKSENRDIIDNVIRQLENASSEESWKEFEVRFQDVHIEFYDNLNKALPDLTPNEKKLCAFLKLNMTTKDISAITHQSVKSITMARYRLRQKLNLERDENLIAFLSKL